MPEFEITQAMWEALSAAENRDPTPAEIARLSCEFGADAARWAFTQWDLRRRATTKFERADLMLFTRAGYEMATHESVARWRANRFGPGEIFDVTAGIGGDALALGDGRELTAIEPDAETRAYLAHNLSVYGIEGQARAGDALAALEERPRQAFADPARRSEGRSLADHNATIPPAAELAARLRHCECAALKLSPLADDEFLSALGGDTEFVSFGRECREALVWFPGQGRFRAAHVESGEFLERGDSPPSVAKPGPALYEADPAAIRAHALGQFGLKGLGDSNGYLTGDSGVDSPWLTEFEVLWAGAWREKLVTSEINERGLRVVAVKKRGVSLDPHVVAKRLRRREGDPAELVIYPDRNSIRAVLVRRTGET